jgi:putative SOS response-associated peptidase YedK
MFAEPDRNTAKPVVNRWFERADGVPFFFAGIWREWQGDVGTIKAPNVGLHRLFAILTTEPNGTVGPIHDKAMPVVLTTAEAVDIWMNGTLEEALKLQKPQPDDALVMTGTTRRRRPSQSIDARSCRTRRPLHCGPKRCHARPLGSLPAQTIAPAGHHEGG